MAVSVSDVVDLLEKKGICCRLTAEDTTVLNAPLGIDAFEDASMSFYTGDDPDRLSNWTDASEGLIICSEKLRDKIPKGPFLFVKEVRLAFILAAHLFVPEMGEGAIHPTAVLDPGASLGHNLDVGPNTVIGAAEIGDNCRIGALVTISDHVRIGNSCTVMDGVHLGDPGVSNAVDSTGRQVLFPHFEKVVIEDHVVLGTGTIIQRGVLSPTTIGEGTILSARCLIGHNCKISGNAFVSAGAVIGGSVTVGERSFLGLGCCIKDNLQIGKEVTIGMNATVTRSCHEQGHTLMGEPAKDVGNMFGAARKQAKLS